jgi:hypothetical protein
MWKKHRFEYEVHKKHNFWVLGIMIAILIVELIPNLYVGAFISRIQNENRAEGIFKLICKAPLVVRVIKWFSVDLQLDVVAFMAVLVFTADTDDVL